MGKRSNANLKHIRLIQQELVGVIPMYYRWHIIYGIDGHHHKLYITRGERKAIVIISGTPQQVEQCVRRVMQDVRTAIRTMERTP